MAKRIPKENIEKIKQFSPLHVNVCFFFYWSCKCKVLRSLLDVSFVATLLVICLLMLLACVLLIMVW